MKKLCLFSFVIAGFFSIAIPQVSAQSIAGRYQDIQDQGLIFAGICASRNAACQCRDYGNCTLDDILQLLVNLSVFIFAISGSVMMLIMVYGGFQWILAHGQSAMVEQGKKALVGAFIGLAIILGAYAAINVIVSVLKTGEIPEQDIEETIGSGAEDILQTQ